MTVGWLSGIAGQQSRHSFPKHPEGHTAECQSPTMPVRAITTISLSQAVITTVCLYLPSVVLAVTSAGYDRLEGVSYSDTPDGTVPAPSLLGCSRQCASTQDWRCGGFSFVPGGTCHLYREANISPRCPRESSAVTDRPAIYRRQACPGL